MAKRLSITFDDEAYRLLTEQAKQAGLEHRMGAYIGRLVRAVRDGTDPNLLARIDALQSELDQIRRQLAE